MQIIALFLVFGCFLYTAVAVPHPQLHRTVYFDTVGTIVGDRLAGRIDNTVNNMQDRASRRFE